MDHVRPSLTSTTPHTPAGARYASWVRVVSGVLRSKLPEPDYPHIEALLQRMVGHGLRVRVSSNLLTQQAYLEMNLLDPNRYPVEPISWTLYTYCPIDTTEQIERTERRVIVIGERAQIERTVERHRRGLPRPPAGGG